MLFTEQTGSHLELNMGALTPVIKLILSILI